MLLFLQQVTEQSLLPESISIRNTPSSVIEDGDDNDDIGIDIQSGIREWINSTRTNQGVLVLPIHVSPRRKRHLEDDAAATSSVVVEVSNCCAICLESYKVGESVTWSTNHRKCQHAFHTDCIVRYLAEVMKNEQKKNPNDPRWKLPCPICRQRFLHLHK